MTNRLGGSLLMRAFFKNQSGATAIEYGLIAALIAVAIIGAVTTLGNETSSAFKEVSDAMKGTA